jgi:type IV pilus assembly protein PilM
MRIFGRSKQTVGLDIGSGLVKAAVVEHGSAGPELTRVVVTPLADDAIVEGEVMDPALVADAVRVTLAAAAEKPGRIVVAIGGRDVIVKRIRMERVKEARRASSFAGRRSSTCRSTWNPCSSTSRSSTRVATRRR